MQGKISHERRDYEAVADDPQSKTIYGGKSQILIPFVKG